ncbi:heme exporter protein CcmD [Rhodovibrio sodomensis]|uniref:Heme exporter protein D n=1 Tax=Rhodovibrio sodomensis TaxID=1088 RepID=A0ABS1DDK7_9PROT|nr:heme exporter protein CcmD [Rhodovibrio sodomensis]MBK1667490.1 heme exporter protein CcmD [Rhodovibrio sodomensis]
MGNELFGEYAAYVWPSYGLTLLVMVGLLAVSLTRLKRLKRDLRALEQAQGGRRRRRSAADADEEA